MSLTTREEGRAAHGAALPRAPIGPRILGAVMLVAGLYLLWYAYRAADGNFALDGPWLAPVVVTAGWVVLALWYLVKQFVSPDVPEGAALPDGAALPEPETEPEPETAEDAESQPAEDLESARAGIQRLPPALLAAALCGYVYALEPLGFVLASAVFFIAAARILGSRRPVRDIVVAVTLALAIYLAFTRLLDIQLPSGVLPL